MIPSFDGEQQCTLLPFQVYNDDLDEDNSDYIEEGEGEEDDDIDSEDDEANESATGQPQEPAAGLYKFFFRFWVCFGNVLVS